MNTEQIHKRTSSLCVCNVMCENLHVLHNIRGIWNAEWRRGGEWGLKWNVDREWLIPDEVNSNFSNGCVARRVPI